MSATAAAPAAKVADLAPAACAAALAQHFPALFGAGVLLPVKLRIQTDIQARAPGVFSRKSLSLFLHRHTTSTPYIRALLASATRFDLDGQPAGDISEEHRAAAVTEMDRRKALAQERRAAQRPPQQRPGQDRPPRPARPPRAGDGATQPAAPETGAGLAPADGSAVAPTETRPPRPPRPQQAPRGGPGRVQGVGAEGNDNREAGRGTGRVQRPGNRSGAPANNSGGRPQAGAHSADNRPGNKPDNRHDNRPGRPPDRAAEHRPRRDPLAPPRAMPASAQPDAAAAPASTGDPAVDAARRERNALLRSFESSTLTKANFLVLKRMTEADLDAQLALARQERQPAPPRDQRPDRR